MANVVLDKEAFFRRMKRLYSEWKSPEISHDDSLTKIDCLMCAVGADEEILYSKSTALQQWLIGYELTDTITVFTEDVVHFLASKKTIEVLRQLENHKEENVPSIKLTVRDRTDKDNENFKNLLNVMKEAKNGKTVGVFAKDNFPGDFCDSWKAAFKDENFEKVDVSPALAYIMAAKEESEVVTIKKACMVTIEVFQKYLKDQIKKIIDADKKVKHSKLSEDVEKILADKRYVSGVDVNHLGPCYPVIIQSGGNYSLKFSVTSDKNFIHFGAIVCSLGARYKSYCSNISRTLLVNPTDAIQENYNFLLNLEEELLKLLVPGKKLCDVYDAGLSYARKEKPDLVDALTKMFGFGMGIEFRESSIIIGPKCNAIVKKGMVFNVYVGLSPLTNKEATDKEGKTYALFIGDTVLVNDDTAATVLTQSKKTIEDIGIFVKDYDKSIRKLTVSVKEFKTELKDGIDNLRTELKEGQERLVQAVNKLTDFLMGQKTKPKPKNKRQTRLTPAITLSRTSTVEPEIASPISHAIADFEPNEPDIASQAVHDISTQDTASETNVADLDNLDFHEEGGSATTNDVPIRFAPIFTKA